MTVSEARRRGNDKWDSENMSYQTVKVRKELLEEFRETVRANGDRVNTVLKNAMEDYIKTHSLHAADPEEQNDDIES